MSHLVQSSARYPTDSVAVFAGEPEDQDERLFRTPSPQMQDIPSFQLQTSQAKSPLNLRPEPPHRALNESRKLLAHLLGQLQNRPMPPSVFDEFKSNEEISPEKSLGAMVQTVRGAVRFKNGVRETKIQLPTPPSEGGDDEEDGDIVFTTDVTYDLMVQLKEVLVISVAQGWEIFHDSNATFHKADNHNDSHEKSLLLRRTKNNSPQPLRRRSPSPIHVSQHQAPELLSQCISILTSIVSEDCRFKIASPRPSRPPYALQALILDVAQFLIHSQRRDPKVISRIGFALLPAFTTFKEAMQMRLLIFFEEGVVRGALEELRYIQGTDDTPIANAEAVPSSDNNNTPVVSIHVDGVEDVHHTPGAGTIGWRPWLSPSSPCNYTLQSTNAPFQSLSVYYLASITPPLLATILESVELGPRRPLILHRFYQLLSAIVTVKVDSYLDVLQVVAYHTRKARRVAIGLLMTIWPKALGHVVISKPFPILSYSDSLHAGHDVQRPKDHPYAHQFVPWHCSSSSSTVFGRSSQSDCHSCSSPIRGFGLFCPFCTCTVHFDCYDYPDGSHVFEYPMAAGKGTQKMAMHRFCHILPSRRGDSEVRVIYRERHTFKLVNLFTLSLCFVCRSPLWGCTVQGLRCTTCMQFVHSSCISNSSSTPLPRCNTTIIDSRYTTIDWVILRDSFMDHYGEIVSAPDILATKTYEEISVCFSVLWMQLQIMNNGLAMGSIAVTQKNAHSKDAQGTKVDEFELHQSVTEYETALSTGKLRPSPSMELFLEENHRHPSQYRMMFDWSALVYITSSLKSSYDTPKPPFGNSSSFLNVSQPDTLNDKTPETVSRPFELVSLARMRDTLGYEFHIFSDAAARHFLAHLHQLGFFDRQDLDPVLFHRNSANEQILCTFPLPLGLDVSNDIETLVAAVEACLSDLDLSVNEVGFLLLVRKFWPNGMASDYALRRLARSVLSWIFAEDDNLATIFRDYLAKQAALPGVRSAHEALPWPSVEKSRPIPKSSMNNGGDYVTSRRALLNRYATRWLLALHDLDISRYSELLYELSAEIADEVVVRDDFFLGAPSAELVMSQDVQYFEKVLRLIIKLSQTAVTAFDNLFVCWLQSVSARNVYQQSMPTLLRLFQRDADFAARSSSAIEATLANADSNGLAVNPVIDPWRVVMGIASKSQDGLLKALPWLYLFAISGVDIPTSTYMEFSSLVRHFNVSLTDALVFVNAVMSSIWLKSIGRQQLQFLFSSLHSHLAPELLHRLQTKRALPDALQFIRQSFASCLLLYGCERNSLVSFELITDDETKHLPSRRKLNVRGTNASDPVIIDNELMNALQCYVSVNIEELSCLVAKFLNMFLTDSPLVEAYEADNFILRNGKMLSACAWQLYDIQRHDISSIRTTFLLRILVVDNQPFQDLLLSWFKPDGSWELRLLAVTRLFRIILDVTSPDFNVEGRQWRSSIIDIFYHYFSAMWADEREEIRLAVDTWSQTLLPAHFDAISLCWNEALTRAPISERARLVAFLIQLRPHFSKWRVISFPAVVEILLEDEYEQKNTHNEDGPAAAHLSMYGLSSKGSDKALVVESDPDMAQLRVSVVLLSLQMVADDIAVDLFSLQKIKIHLLQVIGFSDIAVVPMLTGEGFHVTFSKLEVLSELALPCLNELSTVLDATRPFKLASSAMGGPYPEDNEPWPLLVGSLFVDVLLTTLCGVNNLLSLPILTLKSILESLMIIIYKHDFESRPLQHLHPSLRKAVRITMDLSLRDIGYELRQLALSVVQAFVKRWAALAGSLIYESVEWASKIVISLNHQNQDVLVSQARSFMETTLVTFSSNGAFNVLCKRRLDREFFIVLKHTTDANANALPSSTEKLRDTLLRDTLSRAADNDRNSFQTVLDNLNTYVEVVHHRGYSAELMQFVGLCLTNVSRRTSEWAADAFDPSPLLLLPSNLIQHNKSNSYELLVCMETVLRVALGRFHVRTRSLSRILHVTSTLYRNAQGMPQAQIFLPAQGQSNNITQVILDILADGLRLKARILPLTIISMLEAITTSDLSVAPATTFISSFLAMADDGFHFLQNHAWSDSQSENDFNASVAVAKMVLEAADHDPEIMVRAMAEPGEKSSRHGLDVRAWNTLVLAALSNPADTWASMLLLHFSTFAFSYYGSLKPYLQASTSPPDAAAADINHAYAAIKLWLLLSHKKSFHLDGTPKIQSHGPTREDGGNMDALMIWNELWPHFESLVHVFEIEAQFGTVSPLATQTWASVADLFLFVRHSRTSLVLETSSQIAVLNRLRRFNRKESATSKLTRAVRSMTEAPQDIPFSSLVSQTAKDIVAAEKLQALEARKRDMGKVAPDRNRRDVRIAS